MLIRRSKKQQIESQLRNLALWDLDINDSGHIAIDGLDAIDLKEEYGSPLLIVNKKRLEKDAKNIQQAFALAPSGSKVLYSYKTNCIPGILKEIHNFGIGAEVISPYELWLAERLNVPGNMIVYNGVNKTEESIIQAIGMNIISINIDNAEEVDRVYRIAKKMDKKAHVGIRLGLVSGSQFGLEIKSGEALEVCKHIHELSDYLDLNCVHFNVTSNARTASIHKSCAVTALRFMATIKSEMGLDISYLDIGGGFGVPTTKNMSHIEYGLYRTFGSLPKPPSFINFQPIDFFLGETITEIRQFCKKFNLKMPKLLIEPGRFVTSMSELLLAEVQTIKKKVDGTQFAITDAGRLSIAFPCEFEYHEVFIANRPKAEMDTLYHVMGRICTSADWMFKNRYLPELRPGDILAIMDAGAYFSSYSSNFAFQRPGLVMVCDGQSKILRKHESFDHLVAMDVV